jgi:protease IV
MEEQRPVSRHKWFALGCLTSVILIVLVMALGIGLAIKSHKSISKPVKANSYLDLKLAGQIVEFSEIESDALFDVQNTSAREVIAKIEAAAHDTNIRGILLEPRGVLCSTSTADDIGRALRKFTESGKPVYAYVESCGDRDYYLCSFAQKIIVNPSVSSAMILTGTGSTINYYKRLFDKLGVEFRVVHAGKYKGTGEYYVQDAMSPELRENLTGVVDSAYVRKIETLAGNRNLDRAEIRRIYEQRPSLFIAPDQAIEWKLADEKAYRKDFLQSIRADRGRIVSLSKYDREYSESGGDDEIAVVYMQGEIITAASEWNEGVITAKTYDKIFDDLESDSSVKAVVLRVNSPGGSALESDILHHRIEQLKAKKRVVVSMGAVAASGGYYISCGADRIYAEPSTITGSIGVVSAIPNLSKTMAKLGVTPQSVTRGKFASAFNPTLPFNPDDTASLEQYSQLIYTEFKTNVAAGRHMTPEQVEAIAQGRVYSGFKAREIGLVDEVGTLDDAVTAAGELAHITSWTVVRYPETRTMIETILKHKLDLKTMSTALRGELAEQLAGPSSQTLIDAFRREPAQLLAPWDISGE